MANRSVKVHRCTHPDVDDGMPFSCDCASYIAYPAALDYLARGMARWKRFQKHGGGFVDNMRELVFFVNPKVPRAATIEKAHIERANVGTAAHPYGDENEQKRIEIYGELTQESFAELGAGLRIRGQITPPTEIVPPQPGECTTIRDILARDENK